MRQIITLVSWYVQTCCISRRRWASTVWCRSTRVVSARSASRTRATRRWSSSRSSSATRTSRARSAGRSPAGCTSASARSRSGSRTGGWNARNSTSAPSEWHSETTTSMRTRRCPRHRRSTPRSDQSAPSVPVTSSWRHPPRWLFPVVIVRPFEYIVSCIFNGVEVTSSPWWAGDIILCQALRACRNLRHVDAARSCFDLLHCDGTYIRYTAVWWWPQWPLVDGCILTQQWMVSTSKQPVHPFLAVFSSPVPNIHIINGLRIKLLHVLSTIWRGNETSSHVDEA